MVKSRLKEKFNKEIRPALMKELGLDNIMAVPTITKVVLNSGLGAAKDNPQLIDEMVEEMGFIAGQRPVVTKTKEAISNFKIRENMPIGVKVTLRKDNMWHFIDKLVNIVLPVVKDFQGISKKAFDGNGNYALGMKEHSVFPEIDPNKITKLKSFQIIVNTNAKNDKDAFTLLKALGFPFKK